MDRYCITAARPKDAEHGLKTEFKLWKYEQQPDGPRWVAKGWKRAARIAALLDAGNEVLTAKRGPTGIKLGDAVEVELRIAHNGGQYRISDMPDE